MIIKEIPKNEQPREKLINYGVDAMSNAELLAIILGSGYKENSAIDVANQILYFINNINDLSEITIQELTSIKGVGNIKAMTIIAAVELGKRVFSMKKNQIKFKDANDIFDYFKPIVANFMEEHLYAIYLNAKGYAIEVKEISIGSRSSTLIDEKVIFKWAYKLSSSHFILVHNHPSGDPYPSLNDIKYTESLVKKAKVIDFELVDHVILGNYAFSMRRDLIGTKIFQ